MITDEIRNGIEAKSDIHEPKNNSRYKGSYRNRNKKKARIPE